MKTLIVDDDRACGRILQAIFGGLSEVFYASSPVQAYQICEEEMLAGNPFDLICLDLEMPRYNGFELLLELRTLERHFVIENERSAKVMVVTAHTDTRTYEQAEELGCNSFIPKPVEREVILSELLRLRLL